MSKILLAIIALSAFSCHATGFIHENTELENAEREAELDNVDFHSPNEQPNLQNDPKASDSDPSNLRDQDNSFAALFADLFAVTEAISESLNAETFYKLKENLKGNLQETLEYSDSTNIHHDKLQCEGNFAITEDNLEDSQ